MPRAFTEHERSAIRARIVASMRDALAAGGARRTPISALTRAAGISKGAFYQFFDSKEAEAEALVEEGYFRVLPRDPMTRSTDTWVVEYDEPDPDIIPAETDFSEDGSPGIQDVKSGSDKTSLDGEPYSEW